MTKNKIVILSYDKRKRKKLLPIIEAYANGATIEIEIIKGCWNVEKYPTFCLNASRYRIKPQLKTKFDTKTLKPFDKVITKCSGYPWKCDIFSHYVERENKNIVCCCTSEDYVYDKCILYNDDTKHLVGTCKEAPEYYRYWEK